MADDKPALIPDEDLPLAAISKAVNKACGAEVLLPGEADNLSTIHTWVPTTVTLVNLLLYGGIPMGRFWEVFGESHEGKTALATLLMIAVQRAGGISVYLDAEGTWDKQRALSMGHNNGRHLYMQADTVEKGVQAIDETLNNIRNVHNLTCPLLFVWDTIAASQVESEKALASAKTAEERKKGRFSEGMSSKPRIIREALRRFSLEFPRQQAGLVFCNQTIADFDRFGPGWDTPGGGALKFWSTYRIHIYRSGSWKPDNKTDCGILSTLKMIKCKVGRPLLKIELPLTYDHGWDEHYANLQYLIRSDASPVAGKVVEQRGAYLHIHGPKDVLGTKEITLYRSQLYEKLEKHPGLGDYLRDVVKAEWQACYAP
jgi:RecA/RadA recombinase